MKTTQDMRENKTSSSFELTREIFQTILLPYYNLQNFLPKTLIIFEIVLPFHLPMPIESFITLSCEQAYFSFRFDVVTTNESYKYPLDEDISILENCKTKLHMIAAVELEYNEFIENTQNNINEYFDLFLEHLNKIVLGYMVAKKDDECHYLTKEMFAATTIVETINLATWEKDKNLFLLHEHVATEKGILSKEEMQELMRVQSIVFEDANPFVYGEQFTYTAKRYFKQGFYLEAVIYAQTSVEVLVRTLYEKILQIEGLSEVEIAEKLESTAFMALIKKILPAYLGGDWSLSKSKTPVGKWYKNTYECRNRATHRGKIPTFQEVDEAISSALELKGFIIKRIKANKKKYSTLNQYIA